MVRSRFIFVITFMSIATFIFWNLVEYPFKDTDSIIQENIEYANVDRKNDTFGKDLKYMLLWQGSNYAPFYYFEEGQGSFLKNNCSVIHCYVTTNRKYFNGDLTQFDAIAFNGRTMSAKNLPKKRFSYQKYIYFNMESSDNYPICDVKFDGFFNWTATYKLNSDIPFPYIVIKDEQGQIVGPQINMRWPQTFPVVDDKLSASLKKKTKAAVWFVSNCNSRSGRNKFVKRLQKALQFYGFNVDVYGKCGKLKCPRNKTECGSMLERDYFFYMSLENSLADDYVTEKLLTAMQHDVVPIIYGGANYSRFLPPGSYIDSKKLDIDQLAEYMIQLMETPQMYIQFHRWKSQFTYSNPVEKENVCAVCAALNNDEQFANVTVYNQFRKWWNPDYEKRC